MYMCLRGTDGRTDGQGQQLKPTSAISSSRCNNKINWNMQTGRWKGNTDNMGHIKN